ncbi:MAG: hypothetical protein K9M98_14805 [Cephaloticoccus sp.]|nr:hypothetical protein [Cephaloticoccus sp.]MCF7761767.1 hypothetical protein [Cephaloticoccus sp.]
MPRRNCLCLLFSALALIGSMADRAWAADNAALIGVWQEVSNYLSPEALLTFKDLPEAKPGAEQRERAFCAAVVQLDQQPLSETRLDEVEARLEALLVANQRDAIDSAARYLLGRIAQIYRVEPDVAKAAGYYRDLVERAGPGHWVDLARVKLAVLDLYALPEANPAERIARAEALIPGTTDPLAVRDLHRLVGRAMMFYNWPPAQALSHLLAADAIGGLTGTLGADQLVQIGELAWDTGDAALAKNYYDRLREEFPRDPRIFLMEQRLAGNPVPERSPRFHGR